MFTLLKIEAIGNPRLGFSPAWVDEVIGITSDGFEKLRLRGQKDYSEANSVGSRGVYIYYFLQENRLYHVSAPRNWKKTDEYFCRIKDGTIVKMTFKEATRWALKSHWA